VDPAFGMLKQGSVATWLIAAGVGSACQVFGVILPVFVPFHMAPPLDICLFSHAITCHDMK